MNKQSNSSLRITVVCVVFFLFLVVNKWSNIVEFFGMSGTGAVQSDFAVGQQVSMEGLLAQNGDFITHTHTLTTLSSGIFGLKSKTINLNQYSGDVLIEGTIDTQHEDLYIVDVMSITQLASSGMVNSGMVATGTTDLVVQGVYLPKMGIYLSPEFFDNYALQNSGENGKLLIKSLASTGVITVEGFVCTSRDPNKNCTELSKTFAENNEKTFSSANGDGFYKMAEVNTWFFANGNWFGYFINNARESDVTALGNYLVLPNAAWIAETVLPNANTLCVEGSKAMVTQTKHTAYIDKGLLVTSIQGTWASGTVTCVLAIDPRLTQGATLQSVKFVETMSSTGTAAQVVPTEQTPQKTPILSLDTSVKQFPINLAKSLTYTSTRGGYSIVFPSSNISYESSNIATNLDTNGLNCYMQISVIKYSDKALIKDQPTVKIYECKAKGDVTLPAGYIGIPAAEKLFVIEAIDPAWGDFANNVVVQ